MNIQDINSQAQTVNLSDLHYTTDAAIAFTTTEIVNSGDDVLFFNEDTNAWELGVYLDLWYFISNERETSPFVGDERMMAYIQQYNGGCTYADIQTISKVASSYPQAYC